MCLPSKDMTRMHDYVFFHSVNMVNAESMHVHRSGVLQLANAAPACAWCGHCILCSVTPGLRAAAGTRHSRMPAPVWG